MEFTLAVDHVAPVVNAGADYTVTLGVTDNDGGAGPAGVWSGVTIRVSNGATSAATSPFSVTVTGIPLPRPYAYMRVRSLRQWIGF